MTDNGLEQVVEEFLDALPRTKRSACYRFRHRRSTTSRAWRVTSGQRTKESSPSWFRTRRFYGQGPREIRLSTLLRLVTALDTSPNELLSGMTSP